MKINNFNHSKYSPLINVIIDLLPKNITIKRLIPLNKSSESNSIKISTSQSFIDDITITQNNNQIKIEHMLRKTEKSYNQLYYKHHTLYYEDPNFIEQFNAIINKIITNEATITKNQLY